MATIDDDLLISILSHLERREAELLTWGIVDGSFGEDELYDLIEDYLIEQGAAVFAQDIVNELIERRLLFSFTSEWDIVYRTRMAEAVRLFSRLRLIAPWNTWRVAPSLVSDFRFDVRPRVYPSRNWPLVADLPNADTVFGAVEKVTRLSDLQRQVFKELIHPLQSDGTRKKWELSEFQVRAACRVLSDVTARESRGMIVCAGTGTGKTLAFYIPAFSRVAQKVRSDEHWTKVLALYPRRELLKDQLAEAYQNARRLDEAMLSNGKRKITLGAYYGDTPRRSDSLTHDGYDVWKRTEDGEGYLCPFLACPLCGGRLQWLREDVDARRERLVCTEQTCDHVVEEGEVRLTRQSMMQNPPDFLFTTTEMMNRLMSNHHHSEVIGVGTSNPAPEMVLLDEVHTYSDAHGAQVASLLRRWRHAVRHRGLPQFTGLSATLRSAREFFATLTSLNPAVVEKVAPNDTDMTESKSVEYQLALRGDPVSGTALLSTSIQALMLLRRILDPRQDEVSGGLFGQRAFAFTDNLDVINRFYHNFLDAEGRHPGGWRARPEGSYARFRSPLQEEDEQRFEQGQSWRIAESIGHPSGLSDPLRVDRTSSQDAGVEQASDVVIATASLEVGYNDSRVGGVLQHKAPISMASFLQRKGRAGRPPTMRPWTVVVLSDYGRDRTAYQGYEQLFSPVIEVRNLPVRNRYVQRIQSVFATMDWLAQKARKTSLSGGSVWEDFGEPADDEYYDDRERDRRKRQAWLADAIRDVLDGGEAFRELRAYVRASLDLSDEDTHAVFWEPPRALMSAALPTILRRLESQWNTHVDPDADHEPYDRNPLPEFVPSALFNNLNLPEVNVSVPRETAAQDRGNGRTSGNETDVHAMPVAQAMREFAPGRASRRFGVRRSDSIHWVPPTSLDADDREQRLDIEAFCDGYEIGTVEMKGTDGATTALPCVRPTLLHAAQLPDDVWDSANAFLDWRTQIVPYSEADVEDVSEAIDWHFLIPRIAFYRHQSYNPVEVRRFAVASETEIGFDGGRDSLNARLNFVRQGQRTAIGFTQEVDGMAFHVHVPDDLDTDFTRMDSRKAASLRSAFFEWHLQTNEGLQDVANRFQRDWLYQLSLAAVTSRAALEGTSLKDAFEDVQRTEGGLPTALQQVLDGVFQALPADVEDREDGERQQRIRAELETLCQNPIVEQVLTDTLPVLWEEPGENWEEWIRRRFLSSLGQAIVEACRLLCPEFEGSNLLFDLDPGPRPAEATSAPDNIRELWVTEQTMGGTGIIEEIAQRYRSNPRRFFQLLESALSTSEFELVDTELRRILSLTQNDTDVQRALSDVRDADQLDALRTSNEHLRRLLAQRGILGIHVVYSALQTRILRPRSSASTDALLHQLVCDWKDEQERLGVEIDARIFAYVASRQSTYDTRLAAVHQEAVANTSWKFQTIYGLLWPSGRAVRERAYDSYNPFADLPKPDRLLLRDAMPNQKPPIAVSGASWVSEMKQRLRSTGSARLRSQATERETLQDALLKATTTVIEADVLRLYPRVEGIERDDAVLVATVTLPEVVQ